MDTLSAVTLEPHGTADSAVLWLHGLGASGHDFVPIVPHLGLNKTRFVFPHAPERPVTINSGHVMPAWYDITSLAAGPDREPEADIRETTLQVEAWLDRIAREGVPPERTILAGFSQGGAMALHVGHRFKHRLAGVMVLSAYLLLDDTVATEGHASNVDTPMLFCHGSKDEVVAMARGRTAYQTFVREGREVQWHDFPMAHQVSMEEIAVIKRWMTARFA